MTKTAWRPGSRRATAGTRPRRGDVIGMGIAERVDDYGAVSYVMCAEPQPVPRLDVAGAVADMGRRTYETG